MGRRRLCYCCRWSGVIHGAAGRGRPPQAAARRAGLEGVEKSLPAPSTARTRRSGTPARSATTPASRIRSDTSIDAGSSSSWTTHAARSPTCQAGVGPARAPRPTLRGGLHAAGEEAAGVARVANPVVVVSSGARACPLGIRCQQRVGLWSSATPPGPNTTHERTEPTEHLSSCPSGCLPSGWLAGIVALTPGAVKRSAVTFDTCGWCRAPAFSRNAPDVRSG
jgi:hypothetical protein